MKKQKAATLLSTTLLALLLASCYTGTTTSSSSSTPSSTPTTTPEPESSSVVSEDTPASEESTSSTVETPDDTVTVTNVIFSIEDENGEGTLANPYSINAAQGANVSIPFAVMPNNATDKTLKWEIGRIADGAWTADANTGVTVTKTDSPATVAIGADSEGTVTLKVSTNDGSGIVNYINIVIEEYVPVTGITLPGLLPSTEEGYDYVYKTALGTTWDMSGTMLQRGLDLVAGTLDGVSGYQAPRNLTYWPSLYSMDIVVNPDDASDKNFTVSSDNEDVFVLRNDGSYDVKGAGTATVTVTSYSEKDVTAKIKVEVADTVYPGILKDVYEDKAVSPRTSWDLDSDHATQAQFDRYDDWNLVMMQSNERRGSTGNDGNQKIFYMGEPTRPYGIDIENRVNSDGGGDTTKASGMMWAKLQVPSNAKTFNVKIGSTGSAVQGEYRVLFVEDGTYATHILTGEGEGWMGFTGPNQESTVKLVLDETILGKTGAMVIEHRVPTTDANAELSIKVLNFEGQVDPTGIELARTEATYKPGDSFYLNAKVKPDNVTDGSIRYYVDEASADKGVTVDATGQVTIADTTADGTYLIHAESVANPTYKATFTLTVDAGQETKEWTSPSDIINGVGGEKWVPSGEANYEIIGEGYDFRNTQSWNSLKLEGRTIKATSFILTYATRVFVRGGETYPYFQVRVTDADGTTHTIRAIGSDSDSFYVESDDYLWPRYDLSEFIGETVDVEIGVTTGTHACVNQIKFEGNENIDKAWNNKTELLEGGWTVTGDQDAGVGEGVDIKGTGSYVSQSFLIGSYNDSFTFGARVFHRDGETYPDIKLVVVDGESETLVRASGVETDTVHVDTDDIQDFTYDLSAFTGKRVEIRIQLENAATHCVIARISMA